MIDSYCNDAATLLVSGGYNIYSDKQEPTEQAIKTKYFDKIKLIKSIAGEQVVSSGYFMIPKDVTVTNEDKIRYDGTDYVIIAIQKCKDISQSHSEVWVQ